MKRLRIRPEHNLKKIYKKREIRKKTNYIDEKIKEKTVSQLGSEERYNEE